MFQPDGFGNEHPEGPHRFIVEVRLFLTQASMSTMGVFKLIMMRRNGQERTVTDLRTDGDDCGRYGFKRSS